MEGQRGDMGERFSSELSVVKRGAMAFRFALDGLLFFYTFLTSQPLSEALDPNHPTDRSGSAFFLICALFTQPPLSHGLRPQRRSPPLAVPPDPRRRLVPSKRGEHFLWRRVARQRWYFLLIFLLCTLTIPCIASTTSTPEFRVFPYENASLEPFESAVAALNPVVAVKVRSAAVHAALAEV